MDVINIFQSKIHTFWKFVTIWNHHGKCIKISTNIGMHWLICEIGFKMLTYGNKKTTLFASKTSSRVLGVNVQLKGHVGIFDPN